MNIELCCTVIDGLPEVVLAPTMDCVPVAAAASVLDIAGPPVLAVAAAPPLVLVIAEPATLVPGACVVITLPPGLVVPAWVAV